MIRARMLRSGLILAALAAFMAFGSVAAAAAGGNNHGSGDDAGNQGGISSAAFERVGVPESSAVGVTEFLGFFEMEVGDSTGDEPELGDVWQEEKAGFLVRNTGDDAGTLNVDVSDEFIEGDTMFVLVFVRQPDGSLNHDFDVCTSPEDCHVGMSMEPDANAAGLIGYVEAPGDFPAGYSYDVSLDPAS